MITWRAPRDLGRSCPQPAVYALTPGATGRIVKDRLSATCAGHIASSGRHPATLRDSPSNAFCHLTGSVSSRGRSMRLALFSVPWATVIVSRVPAVGLLYVRPVAS